MSTIFLATPLRQFNANRPQIRLDLSSLAELIPALEKACPGIGARLCDQTGAIKRSVNVFLNNENVRDLKTDEIVLSERDEIHIIPAMAGG